MCEAVCSLDAESDTKKWDAVNRSIQQRPKKFSPTAWHVYPQFEISNITSLKSVATRAQIPLTRARSVVDRQTNNESPMKPPTQ